MRAIYGRYVPEPVKNSLRVQLMLLRRDVEPARANPPTGRLAVVAPHMDDEVFGCGGTIALAADAGARITFVYVTDGSKGYPGARLESPANAEVRRRASRRSRDPGSPPRAAPPPSAIREDGAAAAPHSPSIAVGEPDATAAPVGHDANAASTTRTRWSRLNGFRT